MTNILLLVLGAALPSIILIVWFYYKDKARPEPLRLIFKSVMLGFLGTIPALVLELLLEGSGGFISGIFSELFSGMGFFSDGSVAALFGVIWTAFVTAALVEEGIKLFCVKTFLFKKAAFDEVMDGIVYAVCVSLGFAFAENILYGLSDRGALIFRAFTAVPMHAAAAGIMGYWIGTAKRESDPRVSKKLVARGFCLAVLIHGFYDFFLFFSSAFPRFSLLSVFLAMVVLIGGLVHLGGLVTKAKARDDVLAALHGEEPPLD